MEINKYFYCYISFTRSLKKSIDRDKKWLKVEKHEIQTLKVIIYCVTCVKCVKVQYRPPQLVRSGDQPVLTLNSSEWWQYWPIHPPQNSSIPPVLQASCFVVRILTRIPTVAIWFVCKNETFLEYDDVCDQA